MPLKSAMETCPRRYTLGQRAETMHRNRERVLAAARQLLLKRGIADFSVDAVARQAKLTRQTVHNQFGTRAELLEALCEQMAQHGGMEGIAAAFQQPEPAAILSEYIKVFARFWTADREMTRRIHGLAAVDSDLARVIAGRQKRRMMGAGRIVTMLSLRYGSPSPKSAEIAIRMLYSLTSFEFFDSLAGPDRMPEDVASIVIDLAFSFFGIS